MIRIISDNITTGLQPSSCVLSMAINGVWIVKMEHPYDYEGRWEKIVEEAILEIEVTCLALSGVHPIQQYRIHTVQRGLNSVYVEAYPIALDAFNDAILVNKIASDAITPMDLAYQLSQINDKYNVSSWLPTSETAEVEYEKTNLIAILNGDENCFIEKFGGEIYYDNYDINIYSRIDINEHIVYLYTGRDVSSVVHNINTSDVVTRLYPYSANGAKLNGTGYVDSPLLSHYGVPHAEFINTPYMLCTEDENNADIECFNIVASYKNLLQVLLESRIRSYLEVNEYWGGYKRNIEYLQDTMKFTKAKNKWSGLIEALQKNLTAHVNNMAFKQMIQNWIKEALEFIDDMDGGRDDFVVQKVTLPMSTEYVYAKKGEPGNRVENEWVRIDNKWRWFGNDGYLDSDKDSSAKWSWFSRSENKFFGVKGSSSSDDIRVKGQWLEINGTWQWFKGESQTAVPGTHDKPSTVASAINSILVAIANGAPEESLSEVVIPGWEQALYTRLYTRMREYCNNLYNEGIDKPKLEINLEAMDISFIEGYQKLWSIDLGNTVIFRNGKSTITERVVELDYDCIRKINTRIVLGMPTETITAIISRNMNTSNQKLVAGYGVKIDGNVINIADGGGEQQPGLRWWEETSTHIERAITSVPVGGWTCDDQYLIQSQVEWEVFFDESPSYSEHGQKANNQKAVGAFMHFYYGGYGRKGQAPVILSPVKDAVQLNYSGESIYAYGETISYGGIEWYISCGYSDPALSPSISHDGSAGLQEPKNCVEWDLDYISYSGDLPVIGETFENFYHACLALLEIANVRTRNSFITGINVGENYPFYGGFVASGSMTPENAPFRVRVDGTIYGKDVICGNHTLSNKQDKLTAGDNINITGNTISATDTTYSAGDNITIDENNEISATDTTYEVFDVGEDGLVPAPTSAEASADKYLKADGTWAEVGGGSSDLDAIELTKVEYDALSSAEKNDPDKIYFVSDYDSEDEVVIVHTTDIVDSEYDECYIDKTYTEIQNALLDGKAVRIINSLTGSFPVEYAMSTTTSSGMIFQDISGCRIYDQDVNTWMFKTRRAMVYSSTPSIVRFIDYECGVAKTSN